MLLFNKIKIITANKVILYLFSRYITYFIQFFASILIAVKLGPYYFGTWGFLLLLINLFRVFDFGISNSINVLLVQNKNDDKRVKNLVNTAFLIIGVLCLIILLLAVLYSITELPVFQKFEIKGLFYAVCLIAMFAYVNRLMVAIYRVKNSLFEVAFFQSIIPCLVLIAIFLAEESTLLLVLLGAYLVGHLFSLAWFVKGEKLPRGGTANYTDAKVIFDKGCFLFIYNLCFYLIFISTRTVVSIFYSVVEYGYFTFSFTLANSILLFLEAIAFVVFPKIIDKLNCDHPDQIQLTITSIRSNYVTLSHGLIYLAMLIFPFLLNYIPQYEETLFTVNVIALTILLSTNSFGYNSYLMAQNREKTIAGISAFCLLINIIFAIILVVFFRVGYDYVVIATMIAYLFYSYLCVYFGRKTLLASVSVRSVFLEFFPIGLLIPYLLSLFIITVNSNFIFIPFLLFISLNIKRISEIRQTIMKMIVRPDFINVESDVIK